MTALANINGKEIEIFVHEIIRKDGQSMAVVNKGNARSMMTFLVATSKTNLLEV